MVTMCIYYQSRVVLLVGFLSIFLLAIANADTFHPCPLPTNFHCHSGQCITKDKQCNGRDDCGDRSDEINCETQCEGPKWWRCNDGVCVDALFRCDNEIDCPDKSDELHCSADHDKDFVNFPVCDPDHHQCSDGLCIPNNWKCNGEMDCEDGSDEQHCQIAEFPCQGFVCDNGHCIVNSWRCDGNNDCEDGSDEKDCFPTMDKCLLEGGFFACSDNKTCIYKHSLCDQHPDCPDGSDEGGSCLILEKNCQKQQCSHECLQTPLGPLCVCPAGLQLFNETFCQDINECNISPPICSHTCVNSYGSFRCECRDGYSLMKNNHTCRLAEEDPMIVFNTRSDVRAYNIEKEQYFSVANKANQATGVAYDGKYVYWTQLSKGREGILRAFVNGSNKEVIVNNGVSKPEDISIDWLTGNLYFTDSDFDHIAVCSNDGLHCTILISRQMDKPRAVAVHSNLGVLFWTDWMTPAYIGKANMDGSDQVKLITDNIRWPNGLCIDYQAGKIYWVDAHFSKIESADLDGSNRKVALENVHHPYWLDIYDDTIYWSDWATMSILSSNKDNGKDRQTLVKAGQVYGIQVYYPEKWNRTEVNSCTNAKCQIMCLLKGVSSYTCACPVGMELARDGFSCIETSHPILLIAAGGSLFLTVNHQALGKHNVVVKDTPFREISSVVYDQIKDRAIVYDDARKMIYSVEKYKEDKPLVRTLVDMDIGQIEDMDFDYRTNTLYWCDIYRSAIEVMNLGTHKRTSLTQYNNGDVAIDLALIPEHGYMFVAYRTSEGDIYISKMGMDGKGQLIIIEHGYKGPVIKLHYDKESEQVFISDSGSSKIDVIHSTGVGKRLFRNLRGSPVSITTQYRHLFWTNGLSTKLYWTDKKDLFEPVDRKISMELPEIPFALHVISTQGTTNVKPHECFVSAAQPYDETKYPCSHICLQSSNDDTTGIQIVPETTHRCLCPPGMVLSGDLKTCEELAKCTNDFFLCIHSNLCIQKSKRCDKVWDCEFNEDEIGCSDTLNNCTHHQFKCKDGECIDKESFCDGNPDCADLSDENNCEFNVTGSSTYCGAEQFQCASGLCIDKQFKCDGVAHCPDKDDEDECTKRCDENEFRCASSRCIPQSWECDQSLDCDDGSDEHNKCAYRKPCEADAFKCGNGRCISLSLVCNSENDCRDNTDEIHCPDTESNTTTIKVDKCDDDEYACFSNTSLCLPFEARCNGRHECPRGEDEMGCQPCPSNHFACAWKDTVNHPQKSGIWHGQCILMDWLCDGSFDCMDGSDEDKDMCQEIKENRTTMNYGGSYHPVVIVRDTNCKEAFRCRTGECVDYALLCNGEINCADGSDEGGHCTTACSPTSSVCSHGCLKSPLGAICQCDHGFELAPDGKSCNPAPPACSKHPCHQLCENTVNNTHICLCFPGYQLRLDRKSCKAVGGPMTMLYSLNNTIMRYYPHLEMVKVLHRHDDDKNVTGLDVHSASESLFYSVQELGEIRHYELKTGNEHVVSDLGFPTVLSADWITENIYYVDAGKPTKIRVCHFDKKMCATIITFGKEIVEAMVVDPVNRDMFYCTTLWSHDLVPSSAIFKARLDGSHIKHLSNDAKHCTSLAVDYDRRSLYVVDAELNNIIKLDYEGSTKQLLTIDLPSFSPRNLQFFEDHVYINGLDTKRIVRCDITGKNNCKYVNSPLNGSDLMRIDQLNKQRKGVNICDGFTCEYTCVLAAMGPKCLCPDGTSVGPNTPCENTEEKQGQFSTITKHSYDVTSSTRASSKNVTTVVSVFTICILIACCYVYLKKYNKKNKFAERFSVQFVKPSFSTIIAPFTNIGAAMASKFNAARSPGNKVPTEYENPLNSAPWPKDISKCSVDDLVKRKEIHSTPRIPNLLIDSDSDLECERDLHDGEFREKTLLLP